TSGGAACACTGSNAGVWSWSRSGSSISRESEEDAMPIKKRASKPKARRPTSRRQPAAAAADVPQFFRLNVEEADRDAAEEFYSSLLGVQGRKQAGSRCYYRCGPVTLSVLDVSTARAPQPLPKALYFTVKDLDSAFSRAQKLGCLSREDVHDAPGGGIVVRP